MEVSPEKGRGDRVRAARTARPGGTYWLAGLGSVPGPSLPERKNPSTENATRQVSAYIRCNSPLHRVWENGAQGAERPRTAHWQVGGRGGHGCREEQRSTGRGTGHSYCGGGRGAVAGRSRGGRGAVERGLSVTCILRHIPPRAAAFSGGSGVLLPKSGVSR